MAENEGKSHILGMEHRHTLIDPSLSAESVYSLQYEIFNTTDFHISSKTSHLSYKLAKLAGNG